jgi:hypothetical protein
MIRLDAINALGSLARRGRAEPAGVRCRLFPSSRRRGSSHPVRACQHPGGNLPDSPGGRLRGAGGRSTPGTAPAGTGREGVPPAPTHLRRANASPLATVLAVSPRCVDGPARRAAYRKMRAVAAGITNGVRWREVCTPHMA